MQLLEFKCVVVELTTQKLYNLSEWDFIYSKPSVGESSSVSKNGERIMKNRVTPWQEFVKWQDKSIFSQRKKKERIYT